MSDSVNVSFSPRWRPLSAVQPTPDQRAKLVELARQLRGLAVAQGTLSPFWECVFEIDAYLAGRDDCPHRTPEQWIAFISWVAEGEELA